MMIEVRKLSKQRNYYKPTKKDFWEWFQKINKEVFDGKLKKFRKIQFRRTRYFWAISNGVNVPSKRYTIKKNQVNLHTDLIMKDSYPNKKFFIEILAHEMVHHYEWLFEPHGMSHGQTFWAWKDKLGKFDISLKEQPGTPSKTDRRGRKTLPHYPKGGSS